jgi:hypothetical protein
MLLVLLKSFALNVTKGDFMKKPFSTPSAFAFLFVMAAVTPQSVWASNICEFKGRSPASEEQINCLKEEKDRLEKDMKKLVEDKQKIVQQLDELKSTKKDRSEDESEEKVEKKNSKKVVAENRDQDMADLMGYFTYMLLNQQEQQQAMMNQMFSFMTQSMQSFVYSQPQNDLGHHQTKWNPYSLEGVGETGYQHAQFNNQFSFENGSGIGISMNGQSFYQNPYSQSPQQDFVKSPHRYPAQIQTPMQLERGQILSQPPVSGYDFNPAIPMQSQQQVQPLQQPIFRTQQLDRKPPLEA